MGRRRGSEAILRNILNISRSRSKEEKRKGGKPGSLWCPYGKRDEDVEDDSNAGFYCRGDESNLTPSSSENPNSAGAVFEEKEKDLPLEEVEESNGVEESSRRIIGLSAKLACSELLTRVHQNIKKFSEFQSNLIYVVSI